MTYIFFDVCFRSIALVADNPQFLNRLGETFLSRVSLRFIVLLWGDKSCIKSNALKDIPLYDYREITKLGQESHDALFKSYKEGNCFNHISML